MLRDRFPALAPAVPGLCIVSLPWASDWQLFSVAITHAHHPPHPRACTAPGRLWLARSSPTRKQRHPFRKCVFTRSRDVTVGGSARVGAVSEGEVSGVWRLRGTSEANLKPSDVMWISPLTHPGDGVQTHTSVAKVNNLSLLPPTHAHCCLQWCDGQADQ